MSAVFAAVIEHKFQKFYKGQRSSSNAFCLTAAFPARRVQSGPRHRRQSRTRPAPARPILLFQSRQPVRIYADSRRTISPVNRDLFGSFLEHLGRAIYEGIYDPQSKLSDSNGFRKDVMDEIRKLGVPIIRYPGGNFVSGYNWLDGIGPKANRPVVLDKAWNTINSNSLAPMIFSPGAVSWARNL